MEIDLDSIKSTFNGLARYQGRVGQLSFILHRLTGLGTLLFLSVHILDTSTVYFFPSLYEEAIALYRSTPFIIGEIFLAFSLIYHGVNGVRIAIFDLFSPKSWRASSQSKAALITLAIAVLLWLPAAFIMGRNLLVHNFGL
jgi:succinate dehydrogenase / fumarate reductase cytochrome b subunit